MDAERLSNPCIAKQKKEAIVYQRIILAIVIGFFGIVNSANAQQIYKTIDQCNGINAGSTLVSAALIIDCTKCVKRPGQWGTIAKVPNGRDIWCALPNGTAEIPWSGKFDPNAACPRPCATIGKWSGLSTAGDPNICKCQVAAPPAAASPSFLHAPNGDFTQAHPDTIINYISWDGANWTAKFDGTTFVHAPNGDWSKSHRDAIINYVTWDGSKWTAKLDQNRFLHAPNGDFTKAHPDTILNYKDWPGTKWTARLVMP